MAIEYIHNCVKRVRKKDLAVILASQNLEDFSVEDIRKLMKLLFSIPTHACLFNSRENFESNKICLRSRADTEVQSGNPKLLRQEAVSKARACFSAYG